MNQSPPGGLRNLAGASLAFLTGGVASKALGLLTVPILARLLTPGELGILDIGAGLAATVTTLAVLGSDNAVARFLHADRRGAGVWGAAVVVVAGMSLALLVIGVGARSGIAQLLIGDGRRAEIVAAALLHGVATTLFVWALNVIRLTGAPGWYAAATTGTVVLQSIGGIAVAFIVPDPMATILLWWGVVAAIGGVAILMVRRPAIARPTRAEILSVVRFGAPLVPAAIAWTIGDLGIRGSMAHADLGMVGSYSIASRIVSVLLLAISGFAIAWMPFLFAQEAGARSPEARDGSVGLLAAVGALALGVAALAPELVLLLGGELYRAADGAVAPLAGGLLAYAVLTVIAGAAALELRTPTIAWASVVGMAVQILAAGLLVPSLALVGAAIASLLGYAAAAAILATRIDPRGRLDWGAIMLLTGSAAGLCVLWVLVLAEVAFVIRLLVLAAFLAAGAMAVGPRLRHAWLR